MQNSVLPAIRSLTWDTLHNQNENTHISDLKFQILQRKELTQKWKYNNWIILRVKLRHAILQKHLSSCVWVFIQGKQTSTASNKSIVFFFYPFISYI